MTELTRLQISELVRASLDDKDKLEPILLAQFIKHSHLKVQQDLMNIGIKAFTKSTILSGAIASCPSDMLKAPNSIIDVRASVGTRANNGGYIFSGGQTITITVLEPGDLTWTFSLSSSASYPTGSVISFDINAKTVSIGILNATTTIANLTTLFSTNLFLKNYFSAAFTGSGVVTLVGGSTNTGGTGSSTGWKPAREYSIEDFNRLSENTYLTPTSTAPAYKRNGDLEAGQVLEFLPGSVTYSKIQYYYLLTEMTADSSTSGLGEFEELLITDVTAKCYEKLKLLSNSQEKIADYERKRREVEKSYIGLLESRRADKLKLISNKPND